MLTLLALSLLAQPDLSVSRGYVKLVDDRNGERARIDGGRLIITCPDGTCSGGGAGGTASVVTVDGGILGSLGWIDGGNINATILGTPTIQGTVSVGNFPATQAVTQSTSPWVENQTQVNGVAVAVGAGASNTGTQRVYVAQDDVLSCTLDGGSTTISNTVTIQGTVSTNPPANATTNVTQFGGTNLSTGTGVGGAGIPRVTVSSDSSLTCNAGTNLNTSLLATAANQTTVNTQTTKLNDGTDTALITTAGSVQTDLFSVNGTAVSTAAAGVQKVGIVGNAGAAVDSANNAAPPANVVAVGVETIASGSQPTGASSTNERRPTAGMDGVLWTKPFGPAFFNVGIESGSTSPVVIKAAPGAGLRVYVTDIDIISSTMTGSGTWRLVTGTGGSCGVGTATLLPAGAAANRFWYPPAGDGGVSTFGQPLQMQFLTPIVAPANQDVCVVCVATNTCNAEFNGYIAP